MLLSDVSSRGEVSAKGARGVIPIWTQFHLWNCFLHWEGNWGVFWGFLEKRVEILVRRERSRIPLGLVLKNSRAEAQWAAEERQDDHLQRIVAVLFL
jgi:hypothetical protein